MNNYKIKNKKVMNMIHNHMQNFILFFIFSSSSGYQYH